MDARDWMITTRPVMTIIPVGVLYPRWLSGHVPDSAKRVCDGAVLPIEAYPELGAALSSAFGLTAGHVHLPSLSTPSAPDS